jgi:hypothetical protein
MIAGLAILVHGKINEVGNERMIRESIQATVFIAMPFFLNYRYVKIKKTDFVIEINKNSPSSPINKET